MQSRYIYITNANKTDPSQGHRIKIEKYFETPEQSRAKLPNKIPAKLPNSLSPTKAPRRYLPVR